MSAEAVGYVYRCSPFQGAAFAVHLAIADSVNDQHQHEFWMANGNLATKARVARPTANAMVARLVEQGFLARGDPRPEPGDRDLRRPVRYRFLFPDSAPVYESRGATVSPPLVTRDDKVVSRGDTPLSAGMTRTQAVEPKLEPKKPSTKRTGTGTYPPEVERLCSLMADLVEQGGDPRPTVAERWRTECDRLMRLDRRSPEEVERVMRWALADEFWSSNVLSMPKLRAKFATLRRQAARRDRRGGIDWDKVQVGT